MSLYSEGGPHLPLKDSSRLFLSLLTITAAVYASPNAQVQPSHSAEAHHAQPHQAPELGKLATQNNLNLSSASRSLETTTLTTTRPEATSFSLQISLDSVMKYIMSVANTGVPMVTPTVYAEWYKVHECEEPEKYDSHHNLISGGWHVYSPDSSGFSGGLGDENKNYVFNLTHPENLPNLLELGFPLDQSKATPVEQVIVAERVQPNPSDQNGYCVSW